ncbi:pentapeptide repeat-containing protein [Streptomyces pseudogriseolus]|uniref:pentapeptide repeat-containing protein n=1 Tax=Streptomyces pseudogriseolus TaxID=36817 RepID=UPI003646F246
MDATRDPSGKPLLGDCNFEAAAFRGRNARYSFQGARFTGFANFSNTEFDCTAEFSRTSFSHGVTFQDSTFAGPTSFDRAAFIEGADFKHTTFEDWAEFAGVEFKSLADFPRSKFTKEAYFTGTRFSGYAEFTGAEFGDTADFSMGFASGTTNFTEAVFKGSATFLSRAFHGETIFTNARFEKSVDLRAKYEDQTDFSSVIFTSDVSLGGATFDAAVTFQGAVFDQTNEIGPMSCIATVNLSGAAFNSPVTIALSAAQLDCRRTRWMSTAVLHLRHAQVDFSQAVYEFPVTISLEHAPFVLNDGRTLAEHGAAETGEVRLMSLRGVDAAHLLLSDINMTECLLAGTVHLDQIRLEGDCRFGTPPEGTFWSRGRPVRWTKRRIVAEERHWRTAQIGTAREWNNPSHTASSHVGPAQLAPVYRSLRKSFEDNKNEPGSADFYYGEMEMRRLDSNTPLAERRLLAAYWALSGYGLRATRALSWLILAAVTTLFSLILWGIPADDANPVSSGSATGDRIRLVTETPDPVNPSGPLPRRISTDRFEKGLRVVINSVIFRSSGQNLTTAGTYIEMASRLSEPVLLGLAVLAVRSRVKR